MKRSILLLALAFGCTVDTTGLTAPGDAGQPDTTLADAALPDAARGDAAPDGMVGECSSGMTRSCPNVGACQNRQQECVDGSWGECIETVFPPTPETCDAGSVDEDCDGMSNEGCACADGATVPCGESDTLPCMMGVQRCVGGVLSDVCDGAVFPQEETCNGVDDDCDSVIDDGVQLTFFTDGDGDGVGTTPTVMDCELPSGAFASVGGDCDDDDDEVYPGNAEICDGKDNDCDPSTNEDDDGTTYYQDGDGDGYGDTTVALTMCTDPGGDYVDLGGDCDDAEVAINPGESENCDLIDNNCSGTPDDDEACRQECQAHTYGGHVYQFCAEDRNWGQADNRCNGMGGGAYDLVTIEDFAENTFVSETAQAIDAGSWWIGYTDSGAGNEGDFRWASGSTSTYTLWGDDEPNDGDSITVAEDCVEILSDGRWNDARCWRDRFYICEQAD